MTPPPAMDHQWERLRWARENRTSFKQMKDAADALDIKPGTYRTYEHGPADNGRSPTTRELQRICRRFGVNWVWVLSGTGEPDSPAMVDERLALVGDKLALIPEEKQADAMTAMLGILDAFTPRKAS